MVAHTTLPSRDLLGAIALDHSFEPLHPHRVGAVHPDFSRPDPMLAHVQHHRPSGVVTTEVVIQTHLGDTGVAQKGDGTFGSFSPPPVIPRRGAQIIDPKFHECAGEPPHRVPVELIPAFHVSPDCGYGYGRPPKSPHEDLNPRPAAYKAAALPLSYKGMAHSSAGPGKGPCSNREWSMSPPSHHLRRYRDSGGAPLQVRVP